MRTTGAVGLSVIVVLAVLVGAAVAAPVMPPSPTSGWLLDEGSGSTTHQWDGSKTGTLYQNAGFSTDTPFAYTGNHSLSLSGVGGDRAILDGTATGSAGTFQFWVKPNDTGDPQYLIDGTNGHRTLIYRTSPTNYQMYLNQANIGGFPTSFTPTDEWTHMAVVWDNALPTEKEKVYINGVQQSAYNVGVSDRDPAQVWLGSRFSNNEALNGKIDEYAVWNEPLNPDHIEWLAQNSLKSIPAPAAPPSWPASGWVLDEGSGTQLGEWHGVRTGSLGSSGGATAPTWSTDTPFAYTGNTSLEFTGTSTGVPAGYARLEGRGTGDQGAIAFWVSGDPSEDGKYIMDASGGNRTLMYRYGTGTGSDGFGVYHHNSSLGGARNTLVPDTGDWTHVALVWDNSLPAAKQKLYRDGELLHTWNVATTPRNPAEFFLGSRYSLDEGWDGNIDEFGVWEKALSPSEVLWLARNSVTAIPPSAPPTPITAWLLDEGTGTRVSETSGPRVGQLGAQTGATAPAWSTDTPFGYAGDHSLQFDGTGVGEPSGWARLDGAPSGVQGTISLWVTQDENGKYLMDASNGSRTLMYRGGAGSGTDNFGVYLNQTSVGSVNAGLVPDDGSWTHVAMVWDNALSTERQKFYRNGELFATGNATVSAVEPANVYLGSRFSLNEGWGGKMDEYALWDSALPPEQVYWLAHNSLNTLDGLTAPPPVPVSGWLLDEGSGSQLAQWKGTRTGDLAGPTGGPEWSTDTPFAYAGNHSLRFDNVPGTADRARLDGHTSATKGTVSFWVSQLGDGKYIMDASNGDRTLMYRYGNGDAAENFGVYLNQSSLGTVDASLVPGDGTWTHVAMTWDNSLAANRQKIYKDGVLFATSNVTVGARNPADIFLGSRYSLNEGWNGRIDEYGLWNSVLTPWQIQWLANHSLRSIPTTVPREPVAAWLFNEGTGQTANPLYGTQAGTLHSNVGWSTSTPHGNLGDHALYFDGTSDNRVNFPGHHFGTQGSMQVWAYRQGGAQYLLDSSPGARTLLYAHYSLFMNDTYLGTLDGELIPDDEWTQLLITWDNDATDGMRQKIYKNGDLFAYFDAILNPQDPAMLWLGNRYSNNEPWRGMIDEYALWDVVLTPQEIGWLYQNSLALIPEPATLALLGLGLAALARRRRR